MEDLQERLGHRFRDPALLTRALTTKAFVNDERLKGRHSEDQGVLGILGDTVIRTVFVELLIRAHYPTPDAIAQEKENLERHEALAGIASGLGIGPSLRLGTDEKIQGADMDPTVLAGTLAAIIGAIYLDSGFEASRQAVIRWFGDGITPHHG
jgi:ribonuclease III